MLNELLKYSKLFKRELDVNISDASLISIANNSSIINDKNVKLKDF